MSGHSVGTIVRFSEVMKRPTAKDLGIDPNHNYLVLVSKTYEQGPLRKTLETLEDIQTGRITRPLFSGYFTQVYESPGIPLRLQTN